MKNGYSILTKRVRGIDVNVWFTLLALSLISVSALAYKLVTYNNNIVADLKVLDISGSSKNMLYTGENLTFITKTKGKVTWDFGDSLQAEGNNVIHNYREQGKKLIKIILNGRVVKADTIVIHKNDPVVQPDATDIDPIWGPKFTTVGRNAIFVYNGKKAVKSFEWSIENNPAYAHKVTNKATFNFFAEGNVTVQLQLNSDPAQVYKAMVVVGPAHEKIVTPTHGGGGGKPYYHDFSQTNKPKATGTDSVAQPKNVPAEPHADKQPDPGPAAPSAYKKIANDDLFKALFMDVASGRRTSADFNDYLCSGGSTVVIANGDETNVESICSLLYKSKYKIQSVIVSRDFQKCVTRLNVKFSKKKFGIF